MAYAEYTVVIHKSVKEVFDFIMDGNHNGLWRSSVIEVKKDSDQPVRIGTKFIQTMKGPLGSKISGDYVITECVPEKLIAFKVVSGPARPSGKYTFKSDGAATTVTFTLSLKSAGLARLMDPMINRQMQQEVTALNNIRKYLERES